VRRDGPGIMPVMTTDVLLRPLGEPLLGELLRTAVADAEPGEVMPPVPGPPGWTSARREAFLAFHRSRALADPPVERTWAVTVRDAVIGAARLCPLPEAPGAPPPGGTVEAGLWLARSRRGGGAGGTVLRLLLAEAVTAGHGTLLVRTDAGNTPVRRIIDGLKAPGGGARITRDGATVLARFALTAPDGDAGG
jgi:RimJ/RimL family protein N-acetyltransferase